jgi:ribosomal-protein-serine acetyltransferase
VTARLEPAPAPLPGAPPAERLDADGVLLRRWDPADLDRLNAALVPALPVLGRWLPWARPTYGRDDTAGFLASVVDDWTTGNGYAYAVLGAPSGPADPGRTPGPGDAQALPAASVEPEILGGIALMSRVGPGGLEIGYWLRPEHTGRGYMTRAVTALTREAFRIGADRVEIQHDTANVRSRAIPARLGFTVVGTGPAIEGTRAPAGTGRRLLWRLLRTDPQPGGTHPASSAGG